MKTLEQVDNRDAVAREPASGGQLAPLLERARHPLPAAPGVVVGELLGIAEQGRVPLVTFPGQPTPAAVAARAALDLHAAHVGHPVVLVFEDGDPSKPIVIGVLRGTEGWPLDDAPGQVEVDADGARLIVSAREQLVMRCGQASITLSKDGEVAIKGTRLSSHSSGVNRIKGGSVELN